jgi:hypothetical protein
MKSILAGAFLLAVFFSSPLPAKDWLKIDGLSPLTQRLSIVAENPSNVDNDSALLHIKLANLSSLLPDARAGQIVVVDPASTQKPKRERADEYFVPFQIDDGVLAFAVPLKANEKKPLFIYTAPSQLNLPGFPRKTGWDNRFAYRSFENNLMGFRMETGPGANTTGMAIDLFGKTAKGKGVRLQEIYETGHDSYHNLQYWGIDCLKLGSSPGVGGLYVSVGDKLGRPDSATTFVQCLHSGPVETKLRVTGPVEVAGKKFRLTRLLTLWADERGIDDVVTLEGDDLSDASVGICLRNLPNEAWIEKPADGYVLNHGDHNQPNYKSVGFGMAFVPPTECQIIQLHDQVNGGHVYVLKPAAPGNARVSHHHLAAIWDGDGQINNPADFEKYLQRHATLLLNPATVNLSNHVENGP